MGFPPPCCVLLWNSPSKWPGISQLGSGLPNSETYCVIVLPVLVVLQIRYLFKGRFLFSRFYEMICMALLKKGQINIFNKFEPITIKLLYSPGAAEKDKICTHASRNLVY